ncbi:BESS domain-containing protein [Caenorhabditis elegans]|uniref:BESS domain-containing protein n=1 Tax=Caenorhabditis elegans TaxID=6239 RepID=P91546_CAEEL|nr:BESS domain-containing protein [Caenorhabditis elegans]CCD63695.1 BESS domain-containing protein [Caenorhabditis elegans]|eukprot:NP_494031.1 Uncharacterized protein CELE_ZC204.14 [Caenorhabditis elegans]
MSRKFTKKSRKRASRASLKLANEQKAKKYANSTVPMEPDTDSGSPFSNRYASNRSSQVKPIRSDPPDSEDLRSKEHQVFMFHLNQDTMFQKKIQKNMPSCSDDVANTLVSSFMPEIGSILQQGAHLGDNGTRRRVQIRFVRKNISQEKPNN